MSLSSAPVSLKDRADILDILRGFALLGIIIANSEVFSMHVLQPPEVLAAYPTPKSDKALIFLMHAFVEGKFYSIFSLLFGIGFSIILVNQRSKGKNGLNVFYRRLFILALFGLLHSLLIWDGDILFFYALMGLFLPFFRNVSNRSLLILVIVLLLSPLVFDLVKIISDNKWNASTPFLNKALALCVDYGIPADIFPGSWLIANDSYIDVLHWNHSGTWFGWFFRMEGNRPVKVFALFLLGLYLGRNQWHLHLEQHKESIKKVQRFGFALGIPAGLTYGWFATDGKYLPGAMGLWDTAFYAFSVVPLALVYSASIALWYLKAKNNKLLLSLQPVGQMALTNYITQSVLNVILYYGIGFSLGGKFGPTIYLPIAFAIFLLQVFYSKWWINRFNYGPLEWIWRMLTYGKYLPMKKTNR